MDSAQKPLEVILARNLITSLSTPAFLVGDDGELLFYNEAAGALLGHVVRGVGPHAGRRVARDVRALRGVRGADGSSRTRR